MPAGICRLSIQITIMLRDARLTDTRHWPAGSSFVQLITTSRLGHDILHITPFKHITFLDRAPGSRFIYATCEVGVCFVHPSPLAAGRPLLYYSDSDWPYLHVPV